MSAINVIRQRDRVVLVTDGAVWDVNGSVRFWRLLGGPLSASLSRPACEARQAVAAPFRTIQV
jgi:hypothetical protein